MNENIKKYGTDDDWNVSQYTQAEYIWKEYKDKNPQTIDELSNIISDLMIQHGPDGHCDGNQIISLIVWRLLKK